MVFNGALAAAGHKDHVANTSLIGFFDGVLDQGLVHHGQHLFGRGFGGRQKAGAQTRNGKHGFANAGLIVHEMYFWVKMNKRRSCLRLFPITRSAYQPRRANCS